MDVTTLSRAAVAIDLRSGSKKQGSKRLLDFDSALALVLTIHSRQLASFPVELPGLFAFLYELVKELGNRVVPRSVQINHSTKQFSLTCLNTSDDVLKIETVLTGTWTFMAIRPFYEKLAPIFGMVEVPEPEGVSVK